MPKSDAFKYAQTCSGTVYQTQPTGSLDPRRLIQGQAAYWRSSFAPKREVNQTLILADWSALGWSIKKTTAVIHALTLLMAPAEGFTIYLWQAGTLVQLTPENISCLTRASVRKALQSIALHEVKAFARNALKLADESIRILNNNEINYLLNEETTLTSSAVKLSDLVGMPDIEQSYTFSLIQAEKPTKNEIILDCFSPHILELLKQLKVSFPYATLKQEAINTATLHPEHLGSLVKGNALTCGADIYLLPKDLATLKALHLQSGSLAYTIKGLQVLLHQTKELNELTLVKTQALAPEITEEEPEFAELSELNSLSIIDDLISLPLLERLINKSPQLHGLKLINCKMQEHFSSLNKLCIEHLEVTNTSFSVLNLKTLFLAAPHLKTLNLTSCQQLDDSFFWDEITFNQLEELNLNRTNISLKNLHQILRTTPQLKILYLTHCTNIEGLLSLDDVRLEQLEELYLTYSSISLEFFTALVRVAPNLKIIHANNCWSLNARNPIEGIRLAKLELLHLSNSAISSQNLQILLSAATNLKTINLFHCKQIKADFRLEGIKLESLENLCLSNSAISTTSLKELIQAAPNLHVLELAHCTKLKDDFLLGGLKLECPDRLDVGHNDLSLATLPSLLPASPNVQTLNLTVRLAPNLRSIDLSKCDMPSTFSLNGARLDQLIELDLEHTDISIEDLQTLLQVAPKLQTLNLAHCDNLAGTLTLPDAALPLLETIDLSDSSISPEGLCPLLLATPNLISLDLSDCLDISGDFILGEKKWRYLTRLILGCSSITTKGVNSLLLGVPNLEKLDLSFCSLTTSLLRDELPFKHLGDINLCNASLSLKCLQNILKRAPNVHTLDLSHCRNLIGTLNVEGITVQHLEELSLENTTLTRESINALLEIAPKLDRAYVFSQLIEDDSEEDDSELEDDISLKDEETGSPIAKDKKYIDAATEYDAAKEYHVDKLFYPLNESTPEVQVTQYRLHIVHQVTPTPTPCSIKHAFCLEIESDLKLIPYVIPSLNAAQLESLYLYESQKTLILNQYWQALPSLSPEELLLSIEIDADTEVNVEIQYSTINNQYYLRSIDKHTQEVEVRFTIGIPRKPHTIEDLPGFKGLIDEFLAFKAEQLSLAENKSYTGNDYLSELWKQRKGSCRHRSVVFKCYMAQHHPDIPVRIIMNACHMFVEIYNEGAWHTCDLGGYSARLIINENPTAPSPIEEEQEDDESMPHEGTEEPINTGASLFQTWHRTADTALSPEAYCEQSLAPSAITKRLIECHSTQEVHALSLKLQHSANKAGRPVFVINSFEELVCAAAYINEEGVLTPGPGGPLYQFITTQADGVLVINYGALSPEEIVRCNSLLDKERSIDKCPLLPTILIIGLMNLNKPDYLGDDFYSRFDTIAACPGTLALWEEGLPTLPTTSPEILINLTTIDLFHAQDWRERLLGRWVFSGEDGRLHYEQGHLINALEHGASKIELRNGLWDEPDFVYFWQAAQYLGYIDYQGKRIHIPRELSLYRSEGYDWPSLAPQLIQGVDSTPTVILNPSTLMSFFSCFDINEHQQFVTLPGYILQAAANNTPRILCTFLSRELDENAWAMLLSECRAQGVTLVLHCAPGVTLPEPLRPMIAPISSTTTAWTGSLTQKTTIIQSTDADTTVAQLTATDSDWLVIDATELYSTDLLHRITGKVEATRFIFNKTPCVMTQALETGKRIIIKGALTNELADELADFLMRRMLEEITTSGTLVLVNETNSLSYASPLLHHVTAEEKKACLRITDELLLAQLEPFLHESLSQLQGRLGWLLAHPGLTLTASQQSWAGLYTIHRGMTELAPLNPATSKDEAQAFMNARLSSVTDVLARQPYVFLSGLSGVGKTTFVQKYFGPTTKHKLWQGEDAFKVWAETTEAEGHIILFLDEATLRRSHWRCFEGLFAPSPALLIEGQLYPLTPKHKVIFAGNPVSYGDERHLASFFVRHGNSVWFDTLPAAVLYEEIIKPVLVGTPMQPYTETMGTIVLNVYRFLAQRSTKDVLISPRELQMMVLMTYSYCLRQPSLNNDLVALITTHLAYLIAKPLVPATAQHTFTSLYKPTQELPPATIPGERRASGSFFQAQSRQPIQFVLNELLALRTLRQSAAASDTLSYGGLGGIILEGKPGIGKSEMVKDTLKAHGFKEHQYTDAEVSDKPFYHLAVSLSFDEKINLLLKAFNEGAVVVIDEINSAPMMERLLNDLLMGHYQGRLPKKPGFMIIGTQNPTTMAGRRPPSTALARRLITMELLPYTEAEMNALLHAKGLNPHYTAKLVKDYLAQQRFAQQQHLSPEPTFRDLINIANKTIGLIHVLSQRHAALRSTSIVPTSAPPEAGIKRKRSAISTAEESIQPARAPSPSLFLADCASAPAAKRPANTVRFFVPEEHGETLLNSEDTSMAAIGILAVGT